MLNEERKVDAAAEEIKEEKMTEGQEQQEPLKESQQETNEKEAPAEEGAEESQEENSQEESEEGKEQKKGLFGKKKEKKDKKDEQIADLTDRLKRQMAEFDNYRKRTEKEKAGMYVVGAKEIVEKILPIVDNFERGLGVVPPEQKEDPFVAGMSQIYKQLMTTLEGLGVKPIEAVGVEFNPDFHNAVMHVEDDSVGENIIVEEFQKGYLYKDFVVRHSMVKVAN